MYKHHKESINNMTEHYRENPEITALFLTGSVATGTARPNSDIDGVAVVSPKYFEKLHAEGKLEEVFFGKCTYEGGYFNVHYMTRESIENIAKNGAEPMRNMFSRSRPLFCREPGLPELVAGIPVFQKNEGSEKQFRFYCSFKMFYTYFWKACKPEGYMRFHVASGMIYNLYRLILIENEILFPSVRKLEEYVINAKNKPAGIIETCNKFMETLSDEYCDALVNSYEKWTSYDYPKEHNIVMNNFSNPYDWN